jgi:hypothetical protein
MLRNYPRVNRNIMGIYGIWIYASEYNALLLILEGPDVKSSLRKLACHAVYGLCREGMKTQCLPPAAQTSLPVSKDFQPSPNGRLRGSLALLQ